MSEQPRQQKQRLIITVGLPRSGKSTWAKKTRYPIVCPDAIRLSLHGQAFYGPAEEFVSAISRIMVASLFRAGHWAVIVDACHGTKARRDAWKGIIPNLEILPAVCNTPVDVCLGRLQPTDSEGLREAILRMSKNWEPLSPEEFPHLVIPGGK